MTISRVVIETDGGTANIRRTVIGIPGRTASLSIGTVTTLNASEDATVENVGTANDGILNFGIPAGLSGDVAGPGSAVEDNIATFGPTANDLKDSGVAVGSLATTASVTAADALKANLASPTFTGTPAAPTAAPGTNTTQLATTAFIKAAIDVILGGVASAFDTLSEIVAGFIPNSLLTTRGDLIRRSATVPERVALGLNGQALLSNATDAVWGYSGPPHAVLQDQKAQNTAGGTFTSGSLQDRIINTELYDPYGLVSLASNIFTLGVGTWVIRFSAPGYKVASHQAVLFNDTDTAVVGVGSSEVSAAADAVATRSQGIALVTIAGSKGFKVQHRCGTTGTTSGFGLQANFTTEVYTIVEIWKVG